MALSSFHYILIFSNLYLKIFYDQLNDLYYFHETLILQ